MTADSGLRILAYELWILDSGLWILDSDPTSAPNTEEASTVIRTGHCHVFKRITAETAERTDLSEWTVGT